MVSQKILGIVLGRIKGLERLDFGDNAMGIDLGGVELRDEERIYNGSRRRNLSTNFRDGRCRQEGPVTQAQLTACGKKENSVQWNRVAAGSILKNASQIAGPERGFLDDAGKNRFAFGFYFIFRYQPAGTDHARTKAEIARALCNEDCGQWTGAHEAAGGISS